MTTISEPSAAQACAGKYLTFMLGDEFYGIPVLSVREIIRMIDITPVPQMPPHIRGVINLRGKIIPVLDLRLKFALAPAEATERSCIIVVQVSNSSGGATHTGIMVDGVEEVASITAAEIEEAPDFGGLVDTRYIVGMAKMKGQVKTLLDVGRIVGGAAVE